MQGVEITEFCLEKGDFSLKSINLTVGKGEIFAVLGRTGSGKTLLLESIAGFYRDGTGRIVIDGTPVNSVPIEKSRVGLVYQDYGLFPHMTVYRNIAYGLIMRKLPKDKIRQKVEKIAADFSIDHRLNQYPGTLSGGEKQRVAMARALITDPGLLLLDEPFSALDPATKRSLYRQVRSVRENYHCPIIFVTHDFEEAAFLADRIGIMEEGKLCAVRTPESLFDPYGSESIHRFLGMEKENINESKGII